MMTSKPYLQASESTPPSVADLRPQDTTPQKWTSQTLLAGAREVQIDHAGSTYRLRLTQLGKLILTK